MAKSSKAAELEYELESLQDAYGEVYDDAVKMLDAVRRDHDEYHGESFQWCPREMCRAAADRIGSYS